MSSGYSFEVDFITVGEGERSGDAICMKFGSQEDASIVVIDGGTKESGTKLVAHIKKFYNTETVDLVINTHPDGDHASGLSIVLESLNVKQLWMHRPWNDSKEILDLIEDSRVSEDSLEKRLRERLKAAKELENIAIRKKIPITEPYQGTTFKSLTCIGPTKNFYLKQVSCFREMPKAKEEGAIKSLVRKVGEAISTFVDENWDVETLKEGGITSPENESSVLLFADFSGKHLLFTSDAGIKALDEGIKFLESLGINTIESLKFIQVPHHGSRNNISPSILDRLIGPKLPETMKDTRKMSAYVSSSPGSSTHPRRVVVNAFKRRGAKVCKTTGGTITYYQNMSPREGWGPLNEIEFFDQVEE